MFTKLGRDEVLMVPYKCCCFSARSAQGWIQGEAKIGHRDPLLQRTSSSDWKATAINRMHSNDLEACGMQYWYVWFHSGVKFLTRFRNLFGLIVILPYFNAISVNFYAVKCLIYILNFHFCKWKNVYIKDLNAWRILMNFLCIYFGEKRGGVALKHVYV